MVEKYDVAIIGGGPGGYSAAIKVSQLGGKVVLFEEKQLGGTCLNKGCVPTKTLLEKAHFLDEVRKHTMSGFIKESGLFSWKKVIEKKDDIAKQLNGGVQGILKSYGVAVIHETAHIFEPKKIRTSSGKEYEAEKVIIATGSNNFLPPIDGLKLSERVIDSTGALSLKKLPKHIIILGGGVIGIEFANVFQSFGSKITIVEFLSDILYNEDRETVKYLKKELNKKGIEILTNSQVVKVKEDSENIYVSYEKDGTTMELLGTHLLVATGRKPSLKGIDTKNLELNLSPKGYIQVNDYMETSIRDVYAIGDVNGQYQLAYTAYAQAEVAAMNCMHEKEKLELNTIPRCIFSFPQLASVGYTEEQLREENIEFEKGIFYYGANGKALAMDEPSGYVKTLVSKKDSRIVGCHIVGAYSTELIHTMMVAMKFKATVKDMENMVFSHPTLSEMLKESVLAAEKRAIHTLKAR